MELREYLAPIWRWWWLILLATVVAAVSSFIAVSQQSPIYEASSTVMIGQAINDPNPSNNDFGLSQRLAATYADIAKRQPVRNATRLALGLDRLPDYAVREVPNSQLIEIIVQDTNPDRAQAVANELMHQLILQSPTANQPGQEARQRFINDQLNSLEATIVQTEQNIKALEAEVQTLISANDIADTENQITALQNKLNNLQANYAALLANTDQGAINSLSMIEEASRPEQPIGPNLYTTMIASTIVGFILASGAAYLLEYLDDTIRSPEEIERLVSLSTLGSLARIRSEDSERKLITLRHPRSPASEAFRSLRTGIQFSNVDKPNQTLLITSPNPAEGKSVTAANLAILMAQTGRRVLLVDADLRRPVQHDLFDCSRDHGLTNLLLELKIREDGSTDPLLYEMIQATPQEGLSLLASGLIPPNPSELLGATKMKSILKLLGDEFDFIIVDSPPVLVVTDAVVMSPLVDGLLIVADSTKTKRTDIVKCVDRLRKVTGINILGVALNKVQPTRSYYYNRYYPADYGNSKKSSPKESSSLRESLARFWPQSKPKETAANGHASKNGKAATYANGHAPVTESTTPPESAEAGD